MTIWALGSSILMALLALRLGNSYVALMSMPLAWVACISAVRRSIRVTGDWLSPPMVYLVLSIIRYLVPLALVAGGADRDVAIFRLMGLGWREWVLGYALTDLALLGFLLPWAFTQSLPPLPAVRDRLFRQPRTLDAAGYIGTGIGLVALLLFISDNVSLGDAIFTGSFRSATVQKGTGIFFFMSLLLLSGTALLTCRLLFDRGLSAWVACAPCLVAVGSFWILGGRVRAVIPLAIALILLNYRRQANEKTRRAGNPVRTVLRVVGIIAMTVWLFGAGNLYRGGDTSLSQAPIDALTTVGDWSHWRYTLLVDFGQLHSAAGAVRLGSGGIHGATYIGNLLWPLSQALHLPGRSPGVYIVEKTYRLQVGDWGFHSGAATDAYLNFSLWAVPILAALMGWVMRQVYWRFRLERISGVMYALAFVYSVRIFFEGIENWPETLVVLMSLWVMIRIRPPNADQVVSRGATLSGRRPDALGRHVKLLHIQKVAAMGGSERHLLQLLPALASEGVDVRMLVLANGDPGVFTEPLEDAGIATSVVRAGPDLNPRLVARLVAAIRRERPDLVHTHLLHADLHGQLAARLVGVPAVSSVHSTAWFYRRRPHRDLARLAGRWPQQIIAISQHVARFLEEHRLAPLAKISVVRYGLDPDAWSPAPPRDPAARSTLGLGSDDFVVLIASRLVPHKGHDTLIRATGLLAGTERRLRVLVAGSGELEQPLRSLAQALCPDGTVRFEGYVDDISVPMAACDVVVFPTLPAFGEGFGLVTLEAMALGRPVVASAIDSLPEIVDDGVTGLLIPPGDAAALAAALQRLASDPDLGTRMGRAARERATKEFGLTTMVDGTMAVYRKALNAAPRRRRGG